MAERSGPFNTRFDDAVCPLPSTSGDGIAKTNGADIPDGKGRTTGGLGLPEVTFDAIPNGPGIGSGGLDEWDIEQRGQVFDVND